MTDYMIRIELHRTHDYTELHAQALARGILRVIRAANGDIYELQPGTYCYTGDDNNARGVRDIAWEAATAAGHSDASIAVADAKMIAWTNLKMIRKAA